MLVYNRQPHMASSLQLGLTFSTTIWETQLVHQVTAVQQWQECHSLLLPLGFLFRWDFTGSCAACKLRRSEVQPELHSVALGVANQGSPQDSWQQQDQIRLKLPSGQKKLKWDAVCFSMHTTVSLAAASSRSCCYGSPLVLNQALEGRAGFSCYTEQQLFLTIGELLAWVWATEAFLMKLVGQFFQDPWHSVLWGTEGSIL